MKFSVKMNHRVGLKKVQKQGRDENTLRLYSLSYYRKIMERKTRGQLYICCLTKQQM